MMDETLVQPRKVTQCTAERFAGISGFVFVLDCGHEGWCAVQPPSTLYCADCLDRFLHQVRGVQKERYPG